MCENNENMWNYEIKLVWVCLGLFVLEVLCEQTMNNNLFKKSEKNEIVPLKKKGISSDYTFYGGEGKKFPTIMVWARFEDFIKVGISKYIIKF